jgi:hypothetical protein
MKNRKREICTSGSVLHRMDDLGGDHRGIAIAALVYALMRVGAALYIDCHAKG